ncbi:MAG: hypothetical protein EOP51_02320 [Sphingobacteriales bacterium]|nr:MAG: hypothetical protein EOP51_02320 [Sphingobacteriales bacterium]
MSKGIELITCMPGYDSFYLFDEVPKHVYPAGSLALMQPKPINTQHLQYCLVVLVDGSPLGRLAVYHNPYLTHEHQPLLLIGNFECIDDTAVAKVLMDEVLRESHGYGYVLATMNGSSWDDYRLPVNDCTSPFFTDLLQPAYYSKLFEAMGFDRIHTYYSRASANTFHTADQQLIDTLAAEGIRIRGIDLDNYEADLKQLHKLSTVAFAGNTFYSPIDEVDFIRRYLPLKPYLDPNLVLIAQQGNEPVAFTLALHDAYQPKNERIVVKTLAKHPACTAKGLIDAMIQLSCSYAYANGCRQLVHAFIHGDNKSLLISQKYNGEVLREYALYIKPIQQ